LFYHALGLFCFAKRDGNEEVISMGTPSKVVRNMPVEVLISATRSKGFQIKKNTEIEIYSDGTYNCEQVNAFCNEVSENIRAQMEGIAAMLHIFPD
jgi:hypothetical protein